MPLVPSPAHPSFPCVPPPNASLLPTRPHLLTRLEPVLGLHQLPGHHLVEDGVVGDVDAHRAVHPEGRDALVLSDLLKSGVHTCVDDRQ
eukprot:363512-Chlamydomonas_euryale.AAC.1